MDGWVRKRLHCDNMILHAGSTLCHTCINVLEYVYTYILVRFIFYYVRGMSYIFWKVFGL